jgi:hypothetical protein
MLAFFSAPPNGQWSIWSVSKPEITCAYLRLLQIAAVEALCVNISGHVYRVVAWQRSIQTTQLLGVMPNLGLQVIIAAER